jgi:hypothetical protein
MGIFDDALSTISSSLKIAQIMTPADQLSTITPKKAKQLDFTKDYDVIPIRSDGSFHSYFQTKTGKIEPVRIDDLLSAETPLDECLEAFRDRSFYFIFRGKRIVGLVNHADLDKVHVRVLFYVSFSKLEQLLLSVFRNHFGKSDAWKHVLEDRISKIEQIYDDKKRRNLDTTLFDCMNHSDMLQLLQKSVQLRESLGFHSRNDCEEACSGIEELRNDVMHPAAPTLLSKGVPKLLDRRKRLLELIQKCERGGRGEARRTGGLLIQSSLRTLGNPKELASGQATQPT